MTQAWAGLADHWTFLSLGFAIGMAHALEADHLAAVAALQSRWGGRRSLIVRGAVWGLGHTAALFAICTSVVILGLTITDRVGAALELAVGLTIVGLGLRVLYRLRRDRMHPRQQTGIGAAGMNRHGHAPGGGSHAPVLAIGLLHGAAGSAGLLVLTVAATNNVGQALAYFAVFGLGSIAGMAALTTVASFPLAMVERGAGWMRSATALAIGVLAIWTGGAIVAISLGGLTAVAL